MALSKLKNAFDHLNVTACFLLDTREKTFATTVGESLGGHVNTSWLPPVYLCIISRRIRSQRSRLVFVERLSDPLQHPGSPTSQGAITVAVTSEAWPPLSGTWLRDVRPPSPVLLGLRTQRGEREGGEEHPCYRSGSRSEKNWSLSFCLCVKLKKWHDVWKHC